MAFRNRYIRFTVETNALDFLEKAFIFIKNVESVPTDWKWVILSLHSSLYGFAVAACRGTDSSSVITVSKKGYESLISFDEALKRCQNDSIPPGKCLELSDSEKESIRKLTKHLRNEFEHFQPKGWSIEIHGMPQIALNVLKVIRFLALDCSFYVHLSSTQKRKIKSIIAQSTKILKSNKHYVEVQEQIRKLTTKKFRRLD